ncbi:hypothetical protein [Microvirga ossetica]|uniref:hypothetical protein n=1 Tax=Microvirga ossetica TaxID=1882682 RepID=UPI00130006D0|nr:hypothetical protein [Microvirga ossetica]
MFEPEFCRHLIGLYEQHGGEESGFMREINGKTVAAHDPNHKCEIAENLRRKRIN